MILGIFPPSRIIPYHTFIFLEANVHPIQLFHTLRLLDSLEYVFEQNEYNSSPILEWSVKFASQICHENINKPLDGAYLADIVIDIILEFQLFTKQEHTAHTLC